MVVRESFSRPLPEPAQRPLSVLWSWLGVLLAAALATVMAGLASAALPVLPLAALVGVLGAAWLIQRPVRCVYLLIATVFLESADMSFYVGPTRVRIAQILLGPTLVIAALQAASGMIRLHRVPLLTPLLLYLGCNFVSMLFSPVPQQSAKIFILIASCAVLYTICYLLVRDDPAAWPTVFRWFLLIGLIQIAFGWYQVAAGLANVKLGTNLYIGHLGLIHSDYVGTIFGRPYGTLPEPDNYGAVCVFYALFAGLLWLTDAAPQRLRRLAGVVALAALAGTLIALVRASWFGFIVGVLAAIGYWQSGRLAGLRARRLGTVLLGGLLLTTVLIAGSESVRSVLAKRFISDHAEEAAISKENVRFIQMSIAYSLFRQSPLIGNGPGSFTMLGSVGVHELYYIETAQDFSRLYDPSILTTVLNDTGLVGAAAFLLLAAAYWTYLRRQTGRNRELRARTAALCAHSAFVGYFASFIFTHMFWLPLTWLFLTMVMALAKFGLPEESGHDPASDSGSTLDAGKPMA
ncbi:MAG: hypothetical protein N3D11_06415 [Candidatus Sumerlaeia bacterium]|nr:hypothetical protein [Candidatus Sumerlaeia bacterium]